ELLDVRILVHDHRRLAAELERHGREMLRRGLHDDLADARAAGEEDMVERKLEQRRGDVDAALEQRDFLLIERLADDPGRDASGVGTVVRKLHDAAISGRDRGRERARSEEHTSELQSREKLV